MVHSSASNQFRNKIPTAYVQRRPAFDVDPWSWGGLKLSRKPPSLRDSEGCEVWTMAEPHEDGEPASGAERGIWTEKPELLLAQNTLAHRISGLYIRWLQQR
jgi:hypothetical protein